MTKRCYRGLTVNRSTMRTELCWREAPGDVVRMLSPLVGAELGFGTLIPTGSEGLPHQLVH